MRFINPESRRKKKRFRGRNCGVILSVRKEDSAHDRCICRRERKKVNANQAYLKGANVRVNLLFAYAWREIRTYTSRVPSPERWAELACQDTRAHRQPWRVIRSPWERDEKNYHKKKKGVCDSERRGAISIGIVYRFIKWQCANCHRSWMHELMQDDLLDVLKLKMFDDRNYMSNDVRLSRVIFLTFKGAWVVKEALESILLLEPR